MAMIVGAGNVRAIFHTDAAFAADMCVPYLVELDNGDRVLAPADDDNAIRAVTSVVKPIETMCEELPATTTPKTAADADACEPTPASDPTSRVDCVVELVGLKTQAALNGQRARTLGWSDERQRMGVQLDDGVRIAVRLANLKFLDDQQSATSKTAVAAGSWRRLAAAAMGASPGLCSNGTRGLGYYQDGAADIGEQVQKLMAAAPSKDTPPASDRKGLGAEGEHAIPLISTRQSAIAQLNAMEEELPDASAATPLLPEHGQVEQAYHAYRSLARKPRLEAGGPDETLPWHRFDLEVLLLLLGIRPSVLICHNTKPAFVQKVVEVFRPCLPSTVAGAAAASKGAGAAAGHSRLHPNDRRFWAMLLPALVGSLCNLAPAPSLRRGGLLPPEHAAIRPEDRSGALCAHRASSRLSIGLLWQ